MDRRRVDQAAPSALVVTRARFVNRPRGYLLRHMVSALSTSGVTTGEIILKRIHVALLAATFGFTVSGCSASTGGSDSTEDVGAPDVTVTTKKILKEFEGNEAAADAKYKGKTLKVDGIVDKVDTEMFDDEKYIVQIGGGGKFEVFTVNCNGQSSKAVAKIKKGDKITVVGVFDDGGDLGVELEPCEIQ